MNYITYRVILTLMANYGYNQSFPGLAGATGTRVDSAAKHIMACRVNDNLLAQWCDNQSNARNQLHIDKMKYCVHKDELVLNCGQPLHDEASILQTSTAYPSVVSTLGDMSRTSQLLLAGMYDTGHTGLKFMENKQGLLHMTKDQAALRDIQSTVKDSTDISKIICEIKNMPYFVAQGYALGLAYASSLSGDTVSSVLIGGMATVMNGAFECRSGQMLQWYFDFEVNAFHQSNNAQGKAGQRKADDSTMTPEQSKSDLIMTSQQRENVSDFFHKDAQLTEMEKNRKAFHERSLGMEGRGEGSNAKKRNIAYPKPYMLCFNGTDHYGDKIRIFAKCINGGRPHEPIDLMLMTQSL